MSEYEVMVAVRLRHCCNCGLVVRHGEKYLKQTYPMYGHSNYRNFCKVCGVHHLRALTTNVKDVLRELEQ